MASIVSHKTCSGVLGSQWGFSMVHTVAKVCGISRREATLDG